MTLYITSHHQLLVTVMGWRLTERLTSLINEEEARFWGDYKSHNTARDGGLCFLISHIFHFLVPDQVIDIQTTPIDSKFQLLSKR